MDCKQGEEVPSQPTGVRIDGSKLLTIHTDLVRLTDNWPVEKLERVNTILAKVSQFFLIWCNCTAYLYSKASPRRYF
jgi:hypothetical protein